MEVSNIETGEVFGLEVTKKKPFTKPYLTIYYPGIDALLKLKPSEAMLMLWMLKNSSNNTVLDLSGFGSDPRTVANYVVKLVKLGLIKRATMQTGKKTIKKCFLINPDFGLKRYTQERYNNLVRIWMTGNEPIVPFNLTTIEQQTKIL